MTAKELRSLDGVDLGFSGFVLFVQLAQPVGNSVEPLFSIPELAERLLELQDCLEVLTQRRTVIAQFLKGSPAGLVATPSPAGPQCTGEQGAYDAAIERAFMAAFSAPRRPVALHRIRPAIASALPEFPRPLVVCL